MTGSVDSTLTERIEGAVVQGRWNEIWRSSYMKEKVIIMDAIEEERKRTMEAEEKAREYLDQNDKLTKQIKAMKEYMESKGIADTEPI